MTKLKFENYSLSLSARNTQSCLITIGQTTQLASKERGSSTETVKGSVIGFDDLVECIAKWESKDGRKFIRSVDLREILDREKQITCPVEEEKVLNPDDLIAPNFILLIDDDKIELQAEVHVNLKEPTDPNNEFSDFEIVKVVLWKDS